MAPACLFCDYRNLEIHTVIAEDELAYVRMDNFPASLGHVEVVPKRHVVSFFELEEAEVRSVYALLGEAKRQMQAAHHPDGYNIGVNEGEAAGRSVHHLHIHLIPRYVGDTENPRGGIRHIIPGKGDY